MSPLSIQAGQVCLGGVGSASQYRVGWTLKGACGQRAVARQGRSPWLRTEQGPSIPVLESAGGHRLLGSMLPACGPTAPLRGPAMPLCLQVGVTSVTAEGRVHH